MSIIDVSQINNQEKKEETDLSNKETQIKPVEEPTQSSEEKTIVLDGPLSKIYTEALNIVYDKNNLDNLNKEEVSTESQQMDVVLNFSNIPLDELDNEKFKDKNYMFVTNTDELSNSDEVAIAFEKITNLVNKKVFNKVSVCIEGLNYTKQTDLLRNYLVENKVPVYYTRNSALNVLRNN